MAKRKPDLQFLKNAILKILKSNTDSLNTKQISWALNLKGSEYSRIILRAIKELKRENLIVEFDKYKYRHSFKDLISGTIDINKAGNGYVRCDKYSSDIFIDKKNNLNALNGDVVSVKILKTHRNKLAGKVIDVLSRANSKFVGIIKKTNQDYFFIPDNIKTGSNFLIPVDGLSGAKNNSRVIVEFKKWPIAAQNPTGSVVSVLPKKHTLKTEIQCNIDVFNIRCVFSKKVQEEINKFSSIIGAKEINKRVDFRNTFTITIDPDDAKDFDDALSIQKLDSGEVEIGIHIADVSHYVPINSEVDKEAFLRSFSVYFPGKVVPMLPEKLSNEICSLNPKEDKLCFSVIVTFNKNLETVSSSRIEKTIINSNHRLTYNEANNIILGKSEDLNKELTVLNTVAQNLRKNRIKNGSINFERSSIYFELDDNKEPVKMLKRSCLKAHKLVEEFMLLANKIVANKLDAKKTSIYRVHDLPNQDKLSEIAIYLKQFPNNRLNFNINHKKLAHLINDLLKNSKIAGQKEIIENLILRAMAKAIYSTKNIGHYGLGFEKYTHFTSPIRRYADLVIHRLLNSVINNGPMPSINLEKQCHYFSKTEKIYVDVERKTIKFIQLMLLEGYVGKAFNGIITGVVKWGVYVEIGDGQGEGLISAKDLSQHNYYYNDLKRSFLNRKNGKKYTLGQNISVEIKSINLFKREMDLIILK